MVRKKGFMLIEMLIVVVIIGLLLAIGMGLSRNNLDKMKARATTEELVAFFDGIFLQVNASSYYNTKQYIEIQLTLQKEQSVIPYEYVLSSGAGTNSEESSEDNAEKGSGDFLKGSFAGAFNITSLISGQNKLNTESVTIIYKPYLVACEITASRESIDELSFSVKPKGREEACFQLSSHYCKLKPIPCR